MECLLKSVIAGLTRNLMLNIALYLNMGLFFRGLRVKPAMTKHIIMKRSLDFILSFIGLTVLSPLLLVLTVILYFLHSGHPFFLQERPGKDGKIFRIIKFRTMDREQVTPFGAWLRKLSLDELPQLMNVLSGDMSLVGPRPLLVEYLPLYNKYQRRRHRVLPGITGWAQVNGRNGISWKEKFDFDVWYADHHSLLLDLKILWMTVKKVCSQEGINSSPNVPMEMFAPQPRIWLSSPHSSGRELDYVHAAFAGNWIAPLGPNVDGFEQDIAQYLGENKTVAALSSGTAALHLALIRLGVGRGDVVLCQSFTFSATANPIVYLGAQPVFIDSEPDTWNLSPEFLELAILDLLRQGQKPKAIIVVDLYGMPAKMDEIAALAKKYEIPVIEDAAEALGSLYKGRRCGTFGDYSALSFNGNKIITTSGGGALVCATPEQAEQTRFLSTQARDKAPHYQHSQIGYNYRMSNISAGIGRGQMEVLPERVASRRQNHAFYKKTLQNLPGITVHEEPTADYLSNHWLSCIVVNPQETGGVDRETIRLRLQEEGIESRPLWKPMHLQPVFAECRYYGEQVAEKLFATGLCLPSGSNLKQGELDDITQIIRGNYALFF